MEKLIVFLQSPFVHIFLASLRSCANSDTKMQMNLYKVFPFAVHLHGVL